MDIFTTVLTRVVPVPIKPASLKVKALLKEAATGKLTEDHDHLENHEYYFKKPKDEKHQQQEHLSKKGDEEQSGKVVITQAENLVLEKDEEGNIHLDIFI